MEYTFKNYRYLMLIAMLYITFDLSSLVYAYKEIQVGFLVGMASSVTFPIIYSINDIVTEVYGYRVARTLIWYGILCDYIFSSVTYLISCIPSPSITQFHAYQIVLGLLLRAVTAQTVGVLIGAFINIYLISKWKILTKGKYFWLRSICSSTIGEAIMLIISVLIALSGILSFSTIEHIIFYAYIYKIIFAILASPIASMIAYTLKSKEGIDVYDHDINFTPFRVRSVEY